MLVVESKRCGFARRFSSLHDSKSTQSLSTRGGTGREIASMSLVAAVRGADGLEGGVATLAGDTVFGGGGAGLAGIELAGIADHRLDFGVGSLQPASAAITSRRNTGR